MFDCRILHFGIGNESKTGVERPLLYTAMHFHWFQDPKNWDNERSISSRLRRRAVVIRAANEEGTMGSSPSVLLTHLIASLRFLLGEMELQLRKQSNCHSVTTLRT